MGLTVSGMVKSFYNYYKLVSNHPLRKVQSDSSSLSDFNFKSSVQLRNAYFKYYNFSGREQTSGISYRNDSGSAVSSTQDFFLKSIYKKYGLITDVDTPVKYDGKA